MKLDSKRSDRLPRKRLLRLGVAVTLAVSAFGAQGAGLGRLNVLSSIGQPLRAEIELTAVAPDEAVTAKLAGPDAFAQANIDFGAALTMLRFSVQRRANGTPYVLVTSSQIVNEPFLDVLVELSWSAGRLVREYTLLIDPPNSRDAQREVEPGAVIAQAQAPVRVPAARRAAAPAVASPVPSSSVAAGASTAAAPGASSGAYVVRPGDTAIVIARDNRPEGVSLEQMLAALYRDNQQAFSGNIDRLMAGATVNIPEASSAKAIDGGEARRIVAQSSNFGAYRERIARNATQAPASRASGQQASGKLTTQVDDGSAPSGEVKDRLELSRPDANTRAASSGDGVRSGVAGPSVEDLAAKDRELQETKTRLALLEKNVADLQQLLALKNQSLADLQKGATTKPADVGTAVPAPTPTSAPAAAVVVAAPVVAPMPVAATPAPSPAASVAEAAPVKPAPPPVKAAPTTTVLEESWFDSVRNNTMLLVGLIAIILLLIGYGIFTARRRSKLARFEDSIFVDNSVLHANSVFGTTGGQSVDTANSGFHSNFVPVAGNLPEQNEVDPVAEADVYIAYGRDAQAEEILKEALRSDPSRHAVHLKLLEIYAKRGDAKSFETIASELYAATGGQGEDWKQAASLGLTIDPRNPLYAEVVTPAQAFAVTPRPQPSRNAASIGNPYGGATGLTASDLAMGDPEAYSEHPVSVPIAAAEHGRTDPMPPFQPLAATSSQSMDLDFDLGFANAGLSPLSPAARTTAGTPSSAAVPRDSNGLDFDVGGATRSLIDPFTASAFGAGDASARTAVSLPAFRARAEQEPPPRAESDGFTASDIFGSSIVADTEVHYSDEPPASAPRVASTPASTPSQARTENFRQVFDSHQFDKTEPLDVFSNLNLDLDNGGYESTAVSPDFGARTDVWQAMATKLDLALAYSDIGDREGARELLEEVVRNGDSAQAERARHLISELG
ncbi:MAG: FimV/HubP family polar landmark protein [Burkholderiaceae bacterium]